MNGKGELHLPQKTHTSATRFKNVLRLQQKNVSLSAEKNIDEQKNHNRNNYTVFCVFGKSTGNTCCARKF